MKVFYGAADVTRTHGLRITNALLYQLSYSSLIVGSYKLSRSSYLDK